MPAYICHKPKGSCPTCEHYRHDPDRGCKACFAAQDKKEMNKKIIPIALSNGFNPYHGLQVAKLVQSEQPLIITDPKCELLETLIANGYEVRRYDIAKGEHATINIPVEMIEEDE